MSISEKLNDSHPNNSPITSTLDLHRNTSPVSTRRTRTPPSYLTPSKYHGKPYGSRRTPSRPSLTETQHSIHTCKENHCLERKPEQQPQPLHLAHADGNPNIPPTPPTPSTPTWTPYPRGSLKLLTTQHLRSRCSFTRRTDASIPLSLTLGSTN